MILVLLIWKILDNIFDIVTVFTLLKPAEIDKEIEKCQDFLETCFIEEYEVKLLNFSGQTFDNMNSFKASNKFVKNKEGNYNSFRKSFDVSAIK